MFKKSLQLVTLLAIGLFVFNHAASAAVLSKQPNALGLVGYWSFNDGTGTKAGDSSGSGNTGTLNNIADPPTAISGWNSGKRGKALAFDGSNDSVTVNMSNFPTSALTMAMWIKLPATQPQAQPSFMGYGSKFSLEMGAVPSTFSFSYYDGANYHYPASSASIPDTNWHFLTITLDGASTVKFYLDGVYDVTRTMTAYIAPLTVFYIGTGWNLSGKALIDDVRLYNRALSQSEITALYQSGAVTKKQPSNLGLVGYWGFDEASGTKANDSSGNGNMGTLSGTTLPTWVNGKRGKALSFNGVDDYVDTGKINFDYTDSYSLGLWFKTSHTGVQGLLSNYNGANPYPYSLMFTSLNKVRIDIRDANGNIAEMDTPTALNDGQWHYVIVTKNTTLSNMYIDGIFAVSVSTAILNSSTISAKDTLIGSRETDGLPFNGLIDDVRIYNRALSAAEVLKLYQSGQVTMQKNQNDKLTSGLVGLWSFNGADIAGTTAYDRSGQNNNGIITGGATPDRGKVGQSLKFDGSSGYVDVGGLQEPSALTILAWVKQASGTNEQHIIDFGNLQLFSQTGALVLCNGNCSSVASRAVPANGTWYLAGAVYDGSQFYVTVNGSPGSPIAVTLTQPTGMRIGNYFGGGNYYFNGNIDEVRIYNRALTTAEIKQLYDMGR